jgi:hypothetical protein
MDQTLSLYLIETIPLVDPQQPDYALVLLTLVESILEDPDIILRGNSINSPKDGRNEAEGLDYEARIDELENQIPSRTASSFIQPSTRSPTVIPGSARKTSAEIIAREVPMVPLVFRLHSHYEPNARKARFFAISTAFTKVLRKPSRITPKTGGARDGAISEP